MKPEDIVIKKETSESGINIVETPTQQIEKLVELENQIESVANQSISNEDEITKRLTALNANKIEVERVISKVRGIDHQIEDSKKNAFEKVSKVLGNFYAEHFKGMGKSIVAEFKMRPIYDKYIRLEKESYNIWKKGEKIKTKNPNADLNNLDPYGIRSVHMVHDIFDNAEVYKKIPTFVEKNNYDESNLEDLKTYQEYYMHRRFKEFPGEMVRGYIHQENEGEILGMLYAIQLNQIRKKLSENDPTISENFEAFFQPGTAHYYDKNNNSVFSEENGVSQNTQYSRSITERIVAFKKAIEKDNIILSDEQKFILRNKILDIFENNEDDIALNLYKIEDINSVVRLCDFSAEQVRLINSIIFNIMLKSEKRHWLNAAFNNQGFSYTKDQVDTIFAIVQHADIHPEGIRIPHLARSDNFGNQGQYDVVSIKDLNRFPFTAEQKVLIGEALSASIVREFNNKIGNGDFQYFVDFKKNNSHLESGEFITKEQFDNIASTLSVSFLDATESYIQKNLTVLEGDVEKVEMKNWYKDKIELVPKREMVARNFDIAKVAELVKHLEHFSDNKDRSQELLAKIPWVESIYKMMNFQKRPRRAEYDPWVTELIPLIQTSLMNESMSLNNPKDGEVLFEYIKRIGPRNLPNYFVLFKKLVDAGSVDVLDSENKKEIKSSFGIDVDEVCKKDPKNLNLVFAETEKFRASFGSDLVDENSSIVNKCFASKYGQEFFCASFANSGFGYGGESKKILETYKKYSEKNPEAFKVPEGYLPVTLEIPEFTTKETGDLEDEDKINELLQNPDLVSAHSNIYGALENLNVKPKQMRLEEYNKSITENFHKEIRTIDTKLDEMNTGKDVNQKALDNLTKRREILLSQLNSFNQSSESLLSMNLENIMDSYQELIPDAFGSKHEILMQLSLEDMSTRFPEEFAKIKNPNLIKKFPTLDSVSIFSEFVRTHVGEHYLNKKHGENDAIRTENKNLIKYLKKIWGTQDFETKILSVTNEKLTAFERGDLTSQTKPITIIPSKGIQRIISGHLGSACTSRRAGELAEGKYPNITSYSLVMDKGTQKEKFVGSFLVIETKTKDNQPILVIRANNPSQNMYNTVDTKALVDKIFDEVRNVAKRRNIPFVGVALGHGTASNRTFVTEYHNIAAKERIGLKDNAETNFNGHQIGRAHV